MSGPGKAAGVTVPKLQEAIRAVYAQPGGAAGGGMHVQLDDGNLADKFFDAESEVFLRSAVERHCFALMKLATTTQRRKACATWRASVPVGQL